MNERTSGLHERVLQRAATPRTPPLLLLQIRVNVADPTNIYLDLVDNAFATTAYLTSQGHCGFGSPGTDTYVKLLFAGDCRFIVCGKQQQGGGAV